MEPNIENTQNTQDVIQIPCNIGYRSKNIQLTKPDTHIAIYTIDVEYDTNKNDMKVISKATPHIQFPIYVDKNYNLDEIIQINFQDEEYLNYKQKVYYIMEETDENDEVIALLGMIYCSNNHTLATGIPALVSNYYYFDSAEWDYRVNATNAFGKDFVYPISENRKEK